MTVIGLPESDDSAASFGFGLPPPKESVLSHRGGDVPNIPEISLQSDDPSLDLTGLQKSLEKMALQGNDPETIEEMFAATEEAKTLEVKHGRRDFVDPLAKTVENTGSLKYPKRWRPPKLSRSRQQKMIITPSGGGSDDGDDGSSVSDRDVENAPGNPDRNPYKAIRTSAAWNTNSFLYHILDSNLHMPESFLLAV
jgi:hypothetical protein